MDYFLLIILLLFLIIFPCYFILNYKLTSPTIITASIYAFSALFAFIGLSGWNNTLKLDIRIYIIIILGIIFFAIGELFSYIRLGKEKKKEKYDIRKIVKVSNKKYYLSILIYILTIILTIYNLKKICLSFSFDTNNLIDMISFYRSKTGLFSAEAISFDKITIQLIKFCNIFCVVYLYIFINNTYINKNCKGNFKYLIPILLCFFLGFLQSGRAYLLKYIVSAFIIYSIILIKNKQNKKTDLKFLKKIIISLIIILPLFYFAIPLFGRKVDSNFINYISFYLGSPIPTLNDYLSNNQIINHTYFGENTFYNIYRVLNSLNLTANYKSRSLPFIYFSNLGSNVYTGFFRYYIDFSYIGIIICSFIFGFTFGKLYNLAIKRKNIKYLIFYAYYSSYVVDQFRDELFFTSFINTTTISYFIIINIIVWFIFDTKRKRELV